MCNETVSKLKLKNNWTGHEKNTEKAPDLVCMM